MPDPTPEPSAEARNLVNAALAGWSARPALDYIARLEARVAELEWALEKIQKGSYSKREAEAAYGTAEPLTALLYSIHTTARTALSDTEEGRDAG